MLNRTNRTLSAHLNRLNLGTRSLVVKASELNGKTTLHARTRPAYGHAMRDGMLWSFDPSIRESSRIVISSIPCPSPVVPEPAEGTPVRPPFGPADAFASPAARATDAVACLSAGAPDLTQGRSPQERSRPGREAYQGQRPGQGQGSGGARLRAARDAAAATVAAAGG